VASQFVAENGKVAKPGDPTRTNFVFEAWYKEAAYTTKWNFDNDTVTAATTLYAAWTPVWTVTFNTQQGSDVAPLSGVVNGETVARPAADPTKAGYSFDNWYKDADGTTAWDFATDTITANTVIYAKWIPLYTVTFDTADGSVVVPLTGVLSGAVITKPATNPTLENCAFDAWYKEAAYTTKWDFAADTVTADTTLYARWTVTVSFVANGGAPAPAVQTDLTRGGRAAAPDPEPAIAGKTLMGWYKEAAYTNKWDFNTDTVNGNTTLYAQWDFVAATNITRPADGIIGEALALDAVTVEPPEASITKIDWAVTDPGTTGVSAANTYTPTGTGTVKLTATIKGGGASGDYTQVFDVRVTNIRKVTGIAGIAGMNDIDDTTALGIYQAGTVIDLNAAKVAPPNASRKDIVWSIKAGGEGAGVNNIGGGVFTLTLGGKLTLIAVVTNGYEDDLDVIGDYTRELTFFVDKVSAPSSVDLGEDSSIKLYAGDSLNTLPGDKRLLPADEPIPVGAGDSWYISIDDGYSEIVWRLNGKVSSVTGSKLKLDTTKIGPVVVRVEGKTGGLADDGVYTFIIE
jgi:uncharacterized repeat protein (TIGR02543 family)